MGELIQECSECNEIYQCFPFSHKYNLHQISKHWTNGQRKKLSVLLEQNLPIDPIQETFQLIDDYYYTVITTISRTQQQQQQQHQNVILEPKVEQNNSTIDSLDNKTNRNIVEDCIEHNQQEIYVENIQPEKILIKNLNTIKTESLSFNNEQENSVEIWQNQFDGDVDSSCRDVGAGGGVNNSSDVSGFPCKLCGKILKQKSTLTSHMKTIHKIQKDMKGKISTNTSLNEVTNNTVKINVDAITATALNDDESVKPSTMSPPDHDDVDDDYRLDGNNDNDNDDDNTSDDDYQVKNIKKSKSTKQYNKKSKSTKRSRKIPPSSSSSAQETITKKPPKSVGMKTGELYTCEYCSKTFTRKRYYEAHTARHRGLKDLLKKRRQHKKHLCPICGKRYPEGYHLKMHMFVHGDDRPLKCDICGKGFVIKKTLREHMHIHTGIRPYMCDVEGCGKAFTHATGKRQHYSSVHSGIRRFECEHCEKRFAKKVHLQEHLRNHTGERPYECDFCPMKFKLQGTLRAHRRTHTGERPFVCPLCNKGFIKSHNLKIHLAAKRSCALGRNNVANTAATVSTGVGRTARIGPSINIVAENNNHHNNQHQQQHQQEHQQHQQQQQQRLIHQHHQQVLDTTQQQPIPPILEIRSISPNNSVSPHHQLVTLHESQSVNNFIQSQDVKIKYY